MLQFAVIGGNVRERSASPYMHMAAIMRLGIDAVYSAYDVEEPQLGWFLEFARRNLDGFNVTIPLKEAMKARIDELAPEAAGSGAVNTVAVRGGRLVGHNTDVLALLRLAGHALSGRGVLVLGAGGAARAAIYAARESGASAIYVANRSPERAARLAGEFGARAVPWGSMPPDVEVVVNATPVHDRAVVDLRGAKHYIEFVYNPPETAMLGRARELGLCVVDGVSILVEQGAEAFRIWTDMEPDRDAMRAAVLRFLGRGTGDSP